MVATAISESKFYVHFVTYCMIPLIFPAYALSNIVLNVMIFQGFYVSISFYDYVLLVLE